MQGNRDSTYSFLRLLRIGLVVVIVPVLLTQSANLSMTATPALARQDGASPVVPICALYTVSQEPGHRSQLLALDLRNKQSYLLGDLVEAEIRGLAVHPATGALYAVSENWGEQPGRLYTVDRATGALTAVGPHGFRSITALAFRWTDATLWGWADGSGLVRLDAATGAATLDFASNEKFSSLAWANDGSLLYATDNSSLWSYRDGDSGPQRVADNLPRGTAAVEMRPDGLLAGIARKDEPENSGPKDAHPLEQVWAFVYDPMTRQVLSETAIPTSRHFPGFAGLAWPRACGNASPGGPADIIRQVSLDKTQVCPGESVHVTVQAVHPESPQGVVDVAINGQWGGDQYLQFAGVPGERLIVVSASTPEKFTDSEEASVEVVDCGPAPEYLDVTVNLNPYQEYTVDFEVANAADFSAQTPTYRWDFGDGQTLETGVPFASHSYADALSPDAFYSTFQAGITLQRSGRDDLLASKTVTLWNPYALNKQRGLIQPRVEADERLRQDGAGWTGTYTITNLEDSPIYFTSRRPAYQPCDPDLDEVELPPEVLSLTLGAGEVRADSLVLDDATLPGDACGVALHLAGTAETGEQVGVDVYFQVTTNPLFEQPVSDEQVLAMLDDVATRGLVPDPDYITDEDLDRLSHAGQVVVPPIPTATLPLPQAQATTAVAESNDCDGKPKTPNPIGCTCMPGDPEPEKPATVGSLACSATKEFKRYPPHLPNALKGDIIMGAGCGLVGGLLRQVTPPQLYTHTGIMTRDYYEVTHSTSVEKRYADHLVGFEDAGGFDENVLRYGWPGVVTQSIDQAFNGESRTDPNGNTYLIESFSAEPGRCAGDPQLVYPLVVKPPPALAQSVRPLLRAAADKALATTGHYRFYAYSDAAIALDRSKDGPASAGWAAGTPATVCSQFVWYSLKQVDRDGNGIPDIQLEGPNLEEADLARGAEPDPYSLAGTAKDGLYLYTQAERRAGADYLYSEIHNLAYLNAGVFGDLLWWVPDQFGNQFTNCFIRDDCSSSNSSEAWKNPGEGTAVSPDNILFWDGPDMGGVYGYSERLVYRSGAWARVYRWAPSEGTGTVAGVVMYQGTPMEGAEVTLRAAGNLVTASGPDGRFEFLAVPSGTYEIVAQKALPDIFLSSHSGECQGHVCSPVTVTVEGDTTAEVVLDLLPPPASYRRVTIGNNLLHQGVPGEWPDEDHCTTCVPGGPYWHLHGWYIYNNNDCWSSQWKIAYVSNLACRVDPFARTHTIHWEESVGGTKLAMDVTCTLADDNLTVNVHGTTTLYADATWPRDFDFVLSPGQSEPYEYYDWDSEVCGSDEARLWLRFTNTTQY